MSSITKKLVLSFLIAVFLSTFYTLFVTQDIYAQTDKQQPQSSSLKVNTETYTKAKQTLPDENHYVVPERIIESQKQASAEYNEIHVSSKNNSLNKDMFFNKLNFQKLKDVFMKCTIKNGNSFLKGINQDSDIFSGLIDFRVTEKVSKTKSGNSSTKTREIFYQEKSLPTQSFLYPNKNSSYKALLSQKPIYITAAASENTKAVFCAVQKQFEWIVGKNTLF